MNKVILKNLLDDTDESIINRHRPYIIEFDNFDQIKNIIENNDVPFFFEVSGYTIKVETEEHMNIIKLLI